MLSLALIPVFVVFVSLVEAELPGSGWELLHCLPDLTLGPKPAADESATGTFLSPFFLPFLSKNLSSSHPLNVDYREREREILDAPLHPNTASRETKSNFRVHQRQQQLSELISVSPALAPGGGCVCTCKQLIINNTARWGQK